MRASAARAACQGGVVVALGLDPQQDVAGVDLLRPLVVLGVLLVEAAQLGVVDFQVGAQLGGVDQHVVDHPLLGQAVFAAVLGEVGLQISASPTGGAAVAEAAGRRQVAHLGLLVLLAPGGLEVGVREVGGLRQHVVELLEQHVLAHRVGEFLLRHAVLAEDLDDLLAADELAVGVLEHRRSRGSPA